MLLEYDVLNSSFHHGLQLLGARCRVEQTALPRAMVWHPDTEPESFLLMVSGGFAYINIFGRLLMSKKIYCS